MSILYMILNFTKFVRTWERNIRTSWSIVLLAKLIVPQLVKKFPAYYGTWELISMFLRITD